MITNTAKKNSLGLFVGQRRVSGQEFEFLVVQQLAISRKHSWNDTVDQMVYGRKNCLQRIQMKLSEIIKGFNNLNNPILRKCMKIIIDQITREITTDQNDFQNTLNIQFGHLVSILSAISLIALVGSILILKWFPQLNCDRN